MDLHGWAALATVVLVVECFVTCLIVGVVLYFLNRGVAYILRELRRPFATGRYYLSKVQQVAALSSRRAIAPVVSASVWAAHVNGLRFGARNLVNARKPFGGKEHRE